MNIFNEEYPGKFLSSKSRKKVWLRMLGDYPSEVVYAAAYHLIAISPNWPPNVAKMRETIVGLMHGELDTPNGAEAWEKILLKIQDETAVQLTELEKKALAQTGTLYDLRRSENSAVDRARYINAFEALVKKQHLERTTLPEIKKLVERNSPEPKLPKRPSEPPQPIGEADTPTSDEIKAYVAQVTAAKSIN
jgi:hypothetical protein